MNRYCVGGGTYIYLYLSHRYMHHSEIIYEFFGITRMKCFVILMKLTVFPLKLVKISLLINVWPKSGVMISHYWFIEFIKIHNPWIPFQVGSFGPVVSETMLSSKSASSIWFGNDRAGNFCRFRAEPNQGYPLLRLGQWAELFGHSLLMSNRMQVTFKKISFKNFTLKRCCF